MFLSQLWLVNLAAPAAFPTPAPSPAAGDRLPLGSVLSAGWGISAGQAEK